MNNCTLWITIFFVFCCKDLLNCIRIKTIITNNTLDNVQIQNMISTSIFENVTNYFNILINFNIFQQQPPCDDSRVPFLFEELLQVLVCRPQPRR